MEFYSPIEHRIVSDLIHLQKMISIKDCLNRDIRVTDERIQHIKDSHPELDVDDLEEKLKITLQYPEIIVASHQMKALNFVNIISKCYSSVAHVAYFLKCITNAAVRQLIFHHVNHCFYKFTFKTAFITHISAAGFTVLYFL
jgi:hypothetical protein